MRREDFKDFAEKYLEDNKDIIVNEIFQLVRIPSFKDGSSESEMNIKKMLQAGKDLVEKYGFNAEIKDKYLLAKFGKGEKQIGIFAHGDVVPAVAEDWIYTSPFQPVEKNGFLIGRGVEDNKQAVVVACHMADMIKKSGVDFNSEIVLFMGTDEETGMEDVMAFAENEQMPHISFVPDNEYPVFEGEKGIFILKLVARDSFETILSMDAGMAHNIIPAKALGCVKFSAEKEQEIKTKAAGKENIKFCVKEGKIEITATGVSSHAAYPEGSENAGAVLCDFLKELEFISTSDKEKLSTISQIQKNYYGEFFGIENEQEKFGKLTAANGIMKTENKKCELTLDIRCGSAVDTCEMIEKITTVSQKYGFDVVTEQLNPGFLIDKEENMAEFFGKIYSEVSGDPDSSPKLSSGGTYARKLKNAYSIGTYVKTDEKIEMPAGHGWAHQPDESVSVKGLLKGALINTLMVMKADELINKK